MFVSSRNSKISIILFLFILLLLTSCKTKKQEKPLQLPENVQVDIINATDSVVYVNNFFQLNAVGKFKDSNGEKTRNIYSINKMPSYSDDEDCEMGIPYLILIPNQIITVSVPRDGMREPEDILLWVCRENPAKDKNRLPTMDEYRESLLKNGGVHLSFCQDKYNKVCFWISDKWTMPVTEKAIRDIEEFVSVDYYDKWLLRDGIVYCNGA